MNDEWYTNEIDDYAEVSESIEGVNIKTSYIIVFFLVGLIIAVLSGVRDTYGPIFLVSRTILVFLLVSSILLPARWGIPLFFVLLLVGQDLTQTTSEIAQEGRFNVASIWRMWLGPIAPGRIISACCIIQIIKIMRPVFDRRLKRVIVWFITVPVLTGWIYGGYTTFVRSVEIPNDIRFALLLVLSVILFHSFLRKYPGSLGVMLAVFIGALLGRHFCDVIYWIAGYGPRLAGATRASVDSTKSTVVFLVLLSIYLFMSKKKFFLATVIGLFSGMLVVVYGTRMIWVTSVLCAMVLLYIFGARKAVVMVPVIAILLVVILAIIQSVREESILAASYKSEAFKRAVRGGEIRGNFLERLEPIRYTEIVNSLNTSTKRFSLLWGNGYGSYYTDDLIPFPQSLVSAHPEYSARSGMFYFCHNFVFQMLFKHGLIGMLIIWSLWLVPAWICYKYIFDRRNPGTFNGILGCLLAFIPSTIINLYWTGKGVFISGFAIAVLLSVIDQYEQVQAEAPLMEQYSDVVEQPSYY